MATDAEIKEWLSTREYTADQEITPTQRLFSKYLPPAGVTTWGEWYELLGVTPPKPKKKEPKKSTGTTDSNNIDRFQKELDTAQNAYDTFRATNRDKRITLENALRSAEQQLDSAEKSKNSEKYNQASQAVQRYKRQLDSLQSEEDTLLENLNKAREIYNTERDLSQAERDIKFRQETNQPVSTADQKRAEALRQQRDALRGRKTAPATVRGVPVSQETVGETTTGLTGPAQQQTKPPAQTPTPEPTAGESKVPTAGKKGVKGKKEEKPAPAQDLETILAKTEFWYDLPDYIFTTVPELGGLLVQAVNENWDENKFLSKAKLTPWWQSKTNVFRNRVISKGKYDELKASGVDTSQTEYGQFLSNQMRSVKSRAKQIAGVTLDDAQAQQVAEKIWNGNLDGDTLAIDRLIVPFIGKVTDLYAKSPVTTYGGQALQNYQTLQAIAKANGLNLKDILPQISTTTTGGDVEKAVLQGLASGDIDINKVNQSARVIAAQGQPEYVRNLLNQGYDLEQIYAPYKQVMSSILEITPDQIDLNDPTLRGAINNNGDMNVYDFKKALRKDARWQYTEGADREMTGLAEELLSNFGFVG